MYLRIMLYLRMLYPTHAPCGMRRMRAPAADARACRTPTRHRVRRREFFVIDRDIDGSVVLYL